MALITSTSEKTDNVTHLDTARRARATKATSPPGTSKVSGAAKSNRRLNTDKVDRLKAAIADGSYEIDALSVADKFIEREGHS